VLTLPELEQSILAIHMVLIYNNNSAIHFELQIYNSNIDHPLPCAWSHASKYVTILATMAEMHLSGTVILNVYPGINDSPPASLHPDLSLLGGCIR
jgi:hypothetical protein